MTLVGWPHCATAQILHGNPLLIRSEALYAPLPLYPATTSASGREGLVVVEVYIQVGGAIRTVKVLESFDAHASAAVLTALREWRFSSYTAKLSKLTRNRRNDGEANEKGRHERVGTLLFRFSLRNGEGIVTDLAAQELKLTMRP